MKVLVAVKRTVDANVKVRVKTDSTGIDLANTKMAMNPFCEIAVEEAVRLKEKGIALELVAVSVGEEKAQEQLRAAMALGVDRSILVKAAANLEPLAVAKVLAKIVARERPDLVIVGKQSIDTDNNQVGQMLAALCGMGQGTYAFKLDIRDGKAIVGREVDGGEQTVALKLPAVVTTDLRLNQPRFARLPDIMKAKKKSVEILELAEIGVETHPHMRILKVEEPPPRKSGIRVTGVEELLEKLKQSGVLP